jgi:predicted nucleic acid-binding protein
LRWYIDSSAIIKLIRLENESKALVAALPKRIISSNLSRVEVLRTIKIHANESLESAYAILAEIEMLLIDNTVMNTAEGLPPFITLRTLDSIHLASALTLKNDIEGIITYDKDMAKASLAMDLKTLSPGVK